MARLARIVIPGFPHHVTQRGNRRQQVFFGDQDYRAYLALLSTFSGKANTEVWAYCLMPNHVHLILVPADEAGLHRALGEVHRRYTRRINAANDWKGYLWQGRFASFPMDQPYLAAAARYVELNPVRAGLVKRPEDWAWSSARAHLGGTDDGVARVAPLLEQIGDWRNFLDGGLEAKNREALRRSERTGRPLGSDDFIATLERLAERRLRKRKPGPKSALEEPSPPK